MLAPAPAEQERAPASFLVKQPLSNETDKCIVIKKTPISSAFDLKFCRNEAFNLGQCDHPCIVKFIRCYYVQGKTFSIEMEHLQGKDLSKAQIDGNFEQLWRWIYQVAHALHYIHKKGIIHRDVKLQNLVLDKNGCAKLIDFGASISKQDLEKEGYRMAGTPCYTPPEMILRQKYDEKVDVYALGVCVYLLVFGRTPFEGEDVGEYWDNVTSKEVSFEGTCPQELVGLMRRMMEKDPCKRATTLQILSCQPIVLRLIKKN